MIRTLEILYRLTTLAIALFVLYPLRPLVDLSKRVLLRD